MKLDCIAFVNAQGSTLLTRNALTSWQRIADEVRALTEMHGEEIYALRSFNDKDGNEVEVELITPTALKSGGALARVEFWRPRGHRGLFAKFPADVLLDKNAYVRAGILLTPAEDAVRHAYDYTENPFRRWNPNPAEGTSPAVDVGDIFIVTSLATPIPTAYGVSGIGFSPVMFAGPIA